MLNLRKSLSAAAVAVALCSSPALAGNGRDLLKALPKDSAGVVVVNVEQLAKSPLFQEFYKMATANPQSQQGIAEFAKMIGMDPMLAVRTLSVGLPKGFAGPGLVVLSTSVDGKKLEAAAAQAGMNTKETFQGATLLKAEDGSTLGMLTGQIFLGKNALVKSGIGAAKGKGASVEKNAELMKLVGAAPQSLDLWFAAKIDTPPPSELAHAKSVRGGLDLEKGIDLQIVLTMDSPAEAAKFAQESKAKLDEAKAEPQAKMLGIDTIASKVTFTAKANDVEVKVPLNEADVGRLKSTIGMMMMMANAAGGAGGTGAAPPGGGALQMPAPPPSLKNRTCACRRSPPPVASGPVALNRRMNTTRRHFHEQHFSFSFSFSFLLAGLAGRGLFARRDRRRAGRQQHGRASARSGPPHQAGRQQGA